MDKKSLHTKIPHPQTHTKSVNCLKCFGLTQKKKLYSKKQQQQKPIEIPTTPFQDYSNRHFK